MFKMPPSPFKINLQEEETLRFWKSHHIFQKASQFTSAPEYLLLEQPPAAFARPGLAEARPYLLADALVRYQRMRGQSIRRPFGWQAHGLRVETQAERRLGLASSQQIAAYGQARFNDACHKVSFTYTLEWERFFERSGCWIQGEEAFSTLDDDYLLAVWEVVKALSEKDLLYAEERMALTCGRCDTPLSEWEIALGRQEAEQATAYVRMPLVEDPSTSLLVWSPAPWMLPANSAVAANPDETFVIVEHELPEGGKEKLILARSRVEAVFGPTKVRVYESFKGQHLKGLRYRPLFTFLLPEKPAYFVVMDSEASTAQGSGLLSLAPACEPHAAALAGERGLPSFEILAADGTFRSEILPWRGIHFQAVEPLILQDLDGRGLLYQVESQPQSVPTCRYCGTQLHYRQGRGWYLRMEQARPALEALNNRTLIQPNREGSAPLTACLPGDWLISRERGWGVPLPIWECSQCAARHVPGSLDELAQLAGRALKINDLHASTLDRLQFPCPACGGRLQRAAGVLDEWLELGALPFYLGTGQAGRTACAGGEDGYLWLIAMSTLTALLTGQECSYQALFSPLNEPDSGPDLLETLRKQSADALRWSLCLGQSLPRTSEAEAAPAGKTALQVMREVQAILAAHEDKKAPADRPAEALDAWLLSRLGAAAAEVTGAMEQGNVGEATRLLDRFILDELDGWYLRLARPQTSATAPTLRKAVQVLSAILSPFAPFLAEELFQKLVRFERIEAPASIMLEEWPPASEAQAPDLEMDMALLRKWGTLGEQVRAEAGISPRQPLALARLAAPKAERLAVEHAELLKAALNVQALQAGEGLSGEAAPDWCSAVLPEAALALDIRLTPELTLAGLAAEFIQRVLDFRRRSEFEPGEPIRLFVNATPRLAEAIEACRSLVMAETRCSDIQRFDDESLQPSAEREKRVFTMAEFDGERVTFGIERCAPPEPGPKKTARS